MKQKHNRKNVFISYSHADIAWIKEIKRHFTPIEKYVEFWDDSKIVPGTDWQKDIKKGLDTAKVAILLISADFLSSKYIIDIELPYIIEYANRGELTILSIILKPCLLEEFSELTKFQAVNSLSKPVIKMSEYDREYLWVMLANTIKSLI